MKKAILVLFLFASIVSVTAQENESQETILKQNELKINMSNLIGFKWADFTYERILNEESSLGIGALFTLDQNSNDGLEEYRTFSITPYYRHFFSRKYAEGFFVEAFGMLHSGEDEIYSFDSIADPNGTYRDEKYTDFAVGISVGGKFVTKRGFIAEVYAGIGRDLLGQSEIEVVGRGGVSIGFRF